MGVADHGAMVWVEMVAFLLILAALALVGCAILLAMMVIIVADVGLRKVINGPAKFCPNAKIIHIDIDPASISKTIKADVPIVGPVESVLTEMVAILKEIGEAPNKESVAAWWKQVDEWRGDRGLFPYDKGDGSVIKPQVTNVITTEVGFRTVESVRASRQSAPAGGRST